MNEVEVLAEVKALDKVFQGVEVLNEVGVLSGVNALDGVEV